MEPILYQYSVRAAVDGEQLRALIDEREAASLLLSDNGDITVQTALDSNAASALLRQTIRYAIKQSLAELTLTQPDNLWRDAALQAGFYEADAPLSFSGELALAPLENVTSSEKRLSYRLPPNREHNATSSPLINADGQQQIIEQTDRLLAGAEKFIDILSDDLEPWLYNRADLVNLCIALLQRSNRSRIRVLIRDSDTLLKQHHRLLQAHLRANERLQLKKIGLSAQEQSPQMVLIDDASLLLRQQRQSLHAVVYDNYRQRHKILAEQFEQLWARATPLPELASYQW